MIRTFLGAALLAAIIAGCGGDDPSHENDGLRPIDRRLLEAAYENDVATARRLVADGADVNAKDDSQQSAYLIATSEVGDDPRLLDLTLGAGADVDAKDGYNGTGLIRAAERGYPRIVARLLETDIDVDHVNRLGWTALLEAVVLGEGGRPHGARFGCWSTPARTRTSPTRAARPRSRTAPPRLGGDRADPPRSRGTADSHRPMMRATSLLLHAGHALGPA